MSEQLIVKPWNYGGFEKAKEPYGVVDAEGTPVCEGAYVQVVQKDHDFLSRGEIVRVEAARHGALSATLAITTSRNSSTSIDAEQVKVADGPQVEADFRLAFLQQELSRVEEQLAALYGKRAALHWQLNLAKATAELLQ